ncbi:MAG TPA: CDP-diacylglycerol--glycerol-3-phosphate 3-phosphatidyltransferase [Acidimicrobiales bacterium]|nr:CDP-diacylglycerol--glycerol-3-phosphate 3-phosphatidyltransferase [Acidimicrobiales bacterium]HVV35859.1 CDP-diacylglycerol--glycerol-3-phosphate 3-phosphatidyltransferase [Acidimicrobiales bacterium]
MKTESSFGSSALVTPANLVTVLRLLVSPFLIVTIASGGASWPAVACWVLLTSTDGVDGYLARRHGTTSSGAFLDPLADKVLVLGALAALVSRNDLSALPAILIGVREVAVSIYRSWLAQRGISVPARWWAKVKTVLTEVAIGFALLPLTTNVKWFYRDLIWLAVVLTLVTGAQYFLEGGQRVRAS